MLGKRSSQHRRNPGTTSPRSSAAVRPLLRFAACALVALTIQAIPAADAQAAGCGSEAPNTLVSSLTSQAPGLKPNVLQLALNAATCAAKEGLVRNRELLAVIDYSLPSTQPRLFVFDLAQKKLLFRELVAHGKNSGDKETKVFSNRPGSLATSIGLFVTQDTYFGSNGYSLRLDGLESGVNDRARERAIVMHGAEYVSDATVRALGRLGRSWGCPAVSSKVAKKMIDTLKGGTALFAYYPDNDWLSHSRFLSR